MCHRKKNRPNKKQKTAPMQRLGCLIPPQQKNKNIDFLKNFSNPQNSLLIPIDPYESLLIPIDPYLGDFLEINEFPFRLRCPAGGLDLEKSWFFGNKRISVSTMFPCGRPRPWKIMFLLDLTEFPFWLCCPAGDLDLEKSYFFGNKRRSVLSPLPCGRPRPWKIVIFWK